MERALLLHPDQQSLTPAQEDEAKRFAEAYFQRQLSTEPVDEPQAERLLKQAYQVAGLAPPQHIHWLDGPLQLVGRLVRQRDLWATGVQDLVWGRVQDRVEHSSGAFGLLYSSLGTTVLKRLWYHYLEGSLWFEVWTKVVESV
jgi:hypothetical protein